MTALYRSHFRHCGLLELLLKNSIKIKRYGKCKKVINVELLNSKCEKVYQASSKDFLSSLGSLKIPHLVLLISVCTISNSVILFNLYYEIFFQLIDCGSSNSVMPEGAKLWGCQQ